MLILSINNLALFIKRFLVRQPHEFSHKNTFLFRQSHKLSYKQFELLPVIVTFVAGDVENCRDILFTVTRYSLYSFWVIDTPFTSINKSSLIQLHSEPVTRLV